MVACSPFHVTGNGKPPEADGAGGLKNHHDQAAIAVAGISIRNVLLLSFISCPSGSGSCLLVGSSL